MSTHAVLVKKGVTIEVVSIHWMVVEAGIAIGAGLLAHSLALVAFGCIPQFQFAEKRGGRV